MESCVVLLWLDNVPYTVFIRAYRNGYLQHIVEWYGEEPSPVYSCIPTVSETVEAAIEMGEYAGCTWLIGERRFSRRKQTIIHYKINGRPWLDVNPALKPRSLSSIAGRVVGVDRLLENKYTIAIRDVYGKVLEASNPLAAIEYRMQLLTDILQRYPARLIVATVSFDRMVHIYGVNSSYIHRGLRIVDEYLPGLLKTLRERCKRHLLVMFTDHGSAPVYKHIDIASILADIGLSAPSLRLIGPIDDGYDAVAVSNGRRFATIYLRDGHLRGWRRPALSLIHNHPRVGDLLEALASTGYVAFAAAPVDTNEVRVVGRDCEARVNCVTGELRGECNPFEELYTRQSAISYVDAKSYTSRLVRLLCDIFQSPHMGEILVHPRNGVDFWEPWDNAYSIIASHGGFTPEELIVFTLAKDDKGRVWKLDDITSVYNIARRYITASAAG